MGSDTTAQTTCLFAARAILDCLGDVHVGGPQAIAHPVVGALCALACGVLMDEVLAVRGFPVACEKGLFDAEEAELIGVLRAGMGSMEIYAQGCPLIRESLKRSVSWVLTSGIQSINCSNCASSMKCCSRRRR